MVSFIVPTAKCTIIFLQKLTRWLKKLRAFHYIGNVG